MVSVKALTEANLHPPELNEEIQKLKTKTDEIDAEVKAVKKDVDEVKDKTKTLS